MPVLPAPFWLQVSDQNAYALGGIAGHAGLFSTVGDIHKLAAHLLTAKPDDSFINATTVHLFTKVQLQRRSGVQRGRGRGGKGRGAGGGCRREEDIESILLTISCGRPQCSPRPVEWRHEVSEGWMEAGEKVKGASEAAAKELNLKQ